MDHTTRQGGPAPRRWWHRIGWLLVIWALSVAAMGAVAWLLKGTMRFVGLTL